MKDQARSTDTSFRRMLYCRGSMGTTLIWPWVIHPKVTSCLWFWTVWTRCPVCCDYTIKVPSGYWAERWLAQMFACTLGPVYISSVFSHLSMSPCLSVFCSSLEPYPFWALVPIIFLAGLFLAYSSKGSGLILFIPVEITRSKWRCDLKNHNFCSSSWLPSPPPIWNERVLSLDPIGLSLIHSYPPIHSSIHSLIQ